MLQLFEKPTNTKKKKKTLGLQKVRAYKASEVSETYRTPFLSGKSAFGMSLNHDFVIPGDIIVLDRSADAIKCGHGCYVDGKNIRATLYGRVALSSTEVSVVPSRTEEPIISKIGSVVICRVQKLYSNQVIVEVTHVGNVSLSTRPKGIIKREDICSQSIDSLPIYEFFRPGDLVRAEVSSLGDSKQFYLKTAEASLGVIAATSRSGKAMIPVTAQVRANVSNLDRIMVFMSNSLCAIEGDAGPG